jgi:alpha-beta hydrolase superfamily lysophospholipase
MNTNHFELQLQTSDGIRLYAQGWLPKTEIKAVVCLVHGQGEHSGRYSHVATALNHAGYILLALDLRGNGKSEGKRGHAPSLEILMDDIAYLTDEATKRFPTSPRFLYGHCLGGNLVMNYVLSRRPQLAGVIASSPLLNLTFKPNRGKVMMAWVIAKIRPSLCADIGVDVAMLSRDPKVSQTLKNDPLYHSYMSAGMYISVMRSARWLMQNAHQFPLPLLLMHGSADGVTSADTSYRLAQIAGPNCTFKLWEGFYHELHNEPEKEQVFETITGWLTTLS